MLNHLGDFRRARGHAASAASAYRDALRVAETIGEANEIKRATEGLAGLG